MRCGLRWLTSVVMVATALAALWHTGHGLLRPPPLSISGAGAWLAQRDALVVSFVFVRVLALVAGAYLLLVLVLGGVAQVASGARRYHVLVDRLSFGLAPAVLSTVGLSTVAIAAGPVAHAQVPTSSTATIHAIRSQPPPSPTRATIRAVSAASTTTTTAPSAPAPPPSTTTHDAEQYVVAPGDSLWSVAASRISDVTGRTDLGDDEIASYWRSVLAVNDLANPDLLFVGQTIELPAVTP
jgi:hypothetical protein